MIAATAGSCAVVSQQGDRAVDNPVSSRRDGAIAIIIVDNPPVNALRHAVRAGIRDAFVATRDDAAVEAIVLTGAGRTFMAGADITEVGQTAPPPTPIDGVAVCRADA